MRHITLAICISGLLSGCLFDRDEYCLRLESRIVDPEVQKLLLHWVDNNVDVEAIGSDLNYAQTQIHPGKARIQRHDFDWNILGFDPQGYNVISLVGEIDIAETGPPDFGKINALFFGEVSRLGFLIQIDETLDLGIMETRFQYTKPIADRIWLYCDPVSAY